MIGNSGFEVNIIVSVPTIIIIKRRSNLKSVGLSTAKIDLSH